MIFRLIPFAILAAWLGSIIYTSGYLYRDYSFASYSLPVLGMVDNKFAHVARRSRGLLTSANVTYYVNYEYQAGLRTERCQAQVQQDTYSAVVIGGALPLRFLPAQPGENRIDLPQEIECVRLYTFALLTFSLVTSIGAFYVIREVFSMPRAG